MSPLVIDDTWYDAGALTLGADLLDRHPRMAVVTGSILVEPGGRLDDICVEMAESPLDRPDGMLGHPLLSFLAGVSVVRKSAFESAGGFSPRLWLGGEEELLASDLARNGWHMAYVSEVVAHHQASVARAPHLRRRHGIRSTLWFTWLRRLSTSPAPHRAPRCLAAGRPDHAPGALRRRARNPAAASPPASGASPRGTWIPGLGELAAQQQGAVVCLMTASAACGFS
jgi:GT2 family glycosyltransferase